MNWKNWPSYIYTFIDFFLGGRLTDFIPHRENQIFIDLAKGASFLCENYIKCSKKTTSFEFFFPIFFMFFKCPILNQSAVKF